MARVGVRVRARVRAVESVPSDLCCSCTLRSSSAACAPRAAVTCARVLCSFMAASRVVASAPVSFATSAAVSPAESVGEMSGRSPAPAGRSPVPAGRSPVPALGRGGRPKLFMRLSLASRCFFSASKAVALVAISWSAAAHLPRENVKVGVQVEVRGRCSGRGSKLRPRMSTFVS